MKNFEHDTPDPEAYGRVTNPKRFAVVVDAAYALIDELEGQFDVIRTDWVPDWDYPERTVSFVDGLTLEPNEGVPIRFAIERPTPRRR